VKRSKTVSCADSWHFILPLGLAIVKREVRALVGIACEAKTACSLPQDCLHVRGHRARHFSGAGTLPEYSGADAVPTQSAVRGCERGPISIPIPVRWCTCACAYDGPSAKADVACTNYNGAAREYCNAYETKIKTA
jgi:hypothetical protein